jgi:hypothetical protein
MANYYKGSFVNTQVDYSDNSANEQTIYLTITNTAVFDGSEVQLELADAPVVLQTIDNSEDKFTIIKSKSCALRIFTTPNVSAMAFADGGDTQYKVEIAVNTESDIIFTGWLSLSDLGQTFQPDPNVLSLIATDGIAFLRDTPLTDNDDRFLTNNHPLIKYISWALKKTGLELEIWVQMNLLEEDAIYDSALYHFYNTVYLNAQTFEEQVGTLENCYSVLEKILGEFCIISQQKNVWFIKSVDEANYSSFRICKFDADGDPIEYITETYTKNIGSTEDIAFMNDDARLSLIRPYLSVEQTFDFDYPIEIITNLAFDRGALIDETNPLEKIYKLDNWTMIQGVPGFYAAPSSTVTIHRIYNADDYETDRYIVLTPKTGQSYSLNLVNYARSEAFYIQEKDKFSVSVDWRLPNNIGPGGNGNCDLMKAVLYGDDGSWWLLGVPTVGSTDYTWYDTQNWTTNTGKASISVDFDIDLTEWQNVSWEAPPAPVNGRLYIWVNQFNQLNTGNDDVNIWYANLTFDYVPLINGSYQKFSGQRHKSEQVIDTIASRSNSVFMTDAPKREIKGAMMKKAGTELGYSGNAVFANGNAVTLDGFQTPYFNVNDYVSVINTTSNNGTYRIVEVSYSNALNKTTLGFEQTTVSETDATTTINVYTYELVESFYDSILWPGGGGPTSAFYPYGQHQNQAVWNQYNRVFSAFEATCDGLDTDKVDALNLPDLPDLLHLYYQTDSHPATDDKQFMVLHFEQDTDNCEWNMYMVEVGDTDYPKTYIGHSFKYIQR